MKIISLKSVNDYVNGKMISNKKLEKFENDRDFMMCAINRTNDFKLYKLCSDELKKDYTFVKFYVNKFKDNIEAIDKAASYFLEHSSDDIKNFELMIIMKKLTDKCDKICAKYGISVEATSLIDEGIISAVKADIKDEYSKSAYGLGFTYIVDQYETSEIIMDNYAERMLRDLYEQNRKQFEICVHKSFCNPKDVEEYGIHKYLIDYISLYDQELSSYIQTSMLEKTQLLTPLKDALLSISLKWDIYNKKLLDIKYRQIMRVYDEYMKAYKSNSTCNYYDLLRYVAKVLDIPDELFDYESDYFDEDYDYNPNPNNEETTEDNKHFYQLVETINAIYTENDPIEIKKIHIPLDKCVVTRIRRA